jgi:hypothetical protein
LIEAHHQAAAGKLEAMILKTLYLVGRPVAKAEFRDLAITGKLKIAAGEVSGIDQVSAALMRCFPLSPWREQRRENFARLAGQLNGQQHLAVIYPRDDGSCLFSVILALDEGRSRDLRQKYLIGHNIYPAILWPLEEAAISLPKSSGELSRRSLSLHCNGRYTMEDMDRVAPAGLRFRGFCS